MGNVESLPLDFSAPLLPDLFPLTDSISHSEPLSLVRSLYDTCHLLSASLPYVPLDVFAHANHFLSPNQVILIAKLFEVRGTINIHEYVSVMVLLAAADWKAKAKVLFELFDFDGSEGLNREECGIFAMSLYGGLAKATGQSSVPGKAIVAAINGAFGQIRSISEVTFDLFMDHFDTSPLKQYFSIFKSRETRKLPPPLFSFHHPTAPLTPISLTSISRKSSRISRIAHTPNSFRVLNESSRGTREQLSLPPTNRNRKGLIIDGEEVTKEKVGELVGVFEKHVKAGREGNRGSGMWGVPGIGRKAWNRLRKGLERQGEVDFAAFLRLMYPRATNTQLAILQKWACKGMISSRTPLTQVSQNLPSCSTAFRKPSAAYMQRQLVI
jgi:hypothetical protein